jgi:hypothetical protein
MTGLADLGDRGRADLATLGYRRGRPGSARAMASTTSSSSAAASRGSAPPSGCCASASSNILIIDENPAGYEGPWETYARMRHAAHAQDMITYRPRHPRRSPSAPGGRRSMGPRAGTRSTRSRGSDWMAYLRWYRACWRCRSATRPSCPCRAAGEGLHRLHLSDAPNRPARPQGSAGDRHPGRRRVACAGLRQTGAARERYAHTSEFVDYAALAPASAIGILGGGASAFDNAQHALEAGGAEAHVFVRRPHLPRRSTRSASWSASG